MKNKVEIDIDKTLNGAGMVMPVGFLGLIVKRKFKDSQLPYDEERDTWNLQPVVHVSHSTASGQATRLKNPATASQGSSSFNRKGRFSWFKVFGQKA